jgi:hypothetical protein
VTPAVETCPSGFPDDESLAEALSFGVWRALRAGLALNAGLLQPVAVVAWERVAGTADARDLLREARRARRGLRLVVRAAHDRALLDEAIVHARADLRGDPGDARKIARERG